MTEPSVSHATFVLERHYPVPPAKVFHALSDKAAKQRWFVGPAEWGQMTFEMDFRVGGREVNVGGPAGGPVHRFEAIYRDIVPEKRIIYAYDMHLDDTRISVSLATMEMRQEGTGTRFVFTEQGAFLDGYDEPGQREAGTNQLLDALGRALTA